MVLRVFGVLLFAIQVAAALPATAQDASDSSVATPTTPSITLPHTYGIVRAIRQRHLFLVDGRTVDLAPGTQIVPTGMKIMPGDRIGVFGGYSRPMVIRAVLVTVIRDGVSAGIAQDR